MALALRLKDGDKVYFGDTPVAVVDIKTPTKYVVEVQKPSISERYTITEDRGTQILPNVVISAGTNEVAHLDGKGKGQFPEDTVVMTCQAPRYIDIYREHIYKARKHADNSGNK